MADLTLHPDGLSPEAAREAEAQVEGRAASGLVSVSTIVLAIIGVGFGISGLFEGYFPVSDWGPISLALLAVLFGLAISQARIPHGPALVVLLALTGFWLWSLLSTGWAESIDSALTSANRWMLYSILAAILFLLVRDERSGRVVVSAFTAAVTGVALYIALRLVFGDADAFLRDNRLEDPLGYVNGEAGYLALAFWPLVAAMTSARPRWIRPLAAGAAVVVSSMVVLTASRGVMFGLLASIVVLLALVPGRAQRVWALAAVAAGTALAFPALNEVVSGDSTDLAGTAREAALWSLGAAALTGLAWLAATRGLAGLGARSPERRARVARLATIGVIALGAAGAIGGVAAAGDPLGRVDRAWTEFKNLENAGGESTRVASTGGARYDYWRIALGQFGDHPLRGVGAGNYPVDYYVERRTSEEARQPHSLLFQALGELGLPGLLAFLALAGGLALGLVRRARAASGGGFGTGLTVAAGGAVTVWLFQTSVDWLHIIPGVTAIALCAAAALLVDPRADEKRGAVKGQTRFLATALYGIAIILAAVSVNRVILSDDYTSDGQRELGRDPNLALRKADDALEVNPDHVPALYLRAAALDEIGEYRAARGALVEATRKEPSNYVPWLLLGDLGASRFDYGQAQKDYAQALARNPRDVAIRDLYRFPTLANPPQPEG